MNVLIYDGPGTSKSSITGSFASLSALLCPRYSIRYVSPSVLVNEPWQSTTALLVVPGGRDLAYCEALDGSGTAKIEEYIRRGGKYLGFCAGAYFASKNVEFELGSKIAVQGSRQLGLWSGTSRGCAFPGFAYDTEAGARVTKIKISKGTANIELSLSQLDITAKVPALASSEQVSIYWNGGGVFVGAGTDAGVAVLASYTEKVNVEGGSAAVIALAHSKGKVVLSAVHPEMSPHKMRHAGTSSRENARDASESASDTPKRLNPAASTFITAVEQNAIDQSQRNDRFHLLKIILANLDFEVNESLYNPPALSTMYLLSYSERARMPVINTLKSLSVQDSTGINLIRSDNDTFGLINEERKRPETVLHEEEIQESPENQIKYICIDRHFPDFPLFDARKFFALLHRLHYASQAPSKNYAEPSFGTSMLYAETVTSSQSLLDKNFSLQRYLPNGFTILCSHQLSGRGRGQNSWVSPTGVLSFSSILHHYPTKVEPAGSIVFIQYLVSLAVIESVLKLRPQLDVRIKWPNDIYIAVPDTLQTSAAPIKAAGKSYAKISGSLISTSWYGGQYIMTLGVGINVSNPHPTVSLNSILGNEDSISMEELLATILVTFSEHYQRFVAAECSFATFEERYYELWLHTDQKVKIESTDETGIVRGLNLKDGTLKVQSSKGEICLQADGNSFDMMKGLIKIKK